VYEIQTKDASYRTDARERNSSGGAVRQIAQHHISNTLTLSIL
jgi:hypothetical protein